MTRPLTPTMIATAAVEAIMTEALLTPKPGLVDRRGTGGHTDMDLAMLLRSAESLFDTFEALAHAGSGSAPGQLLRDEVGALGREGERVMLETTGGVNTHRGALWTIGLLATGAGATGSASGAVAFAAELARRPDSAGPPRASSHGQRAVRRYGVGGAVGEAVAGFPHIVHVALPMLRGARAGGATDETARLRALLALIATVDDTCILHRGGADGLRWMQRLARRTLDAPRFGVALHRFADEADRRRLSPGGSADLLAGAMFVDSLSRPSISTSSANLELANAHL
ncbi:triphosphoribosyl-dephospho-CoA synthase MdcB [Curtobacterium sp. RIT-PI-V]|uniref:triphosphoribosyl-dephospho-CoA synthase MdcB n=1 Tax=Curtobacterium sp. RIT-PI-V TaxID=3035296 RepID=UPI0021D79763|nr:triphosphoribosyl-dephospho-CoA synthase MdcB [Curtobacterium sp. RIT-PI-V]